MKIIIEKSTYHFNKNIILILIYLTITTLNAQVGIGTNTPSNDAMLDISSTNKGLLVPRINLENTTLPNPLSAHVTGMFIFNLATVGDVTPGYYFNDGSKWIRLASNQEVLKLGVWKNSDNSIATTNSTNINFSNGNVSIGTTDAIATLNIKDNNNQAPAILITGASQTEGDIAVKNTDTMQLGKWDTATNDYTNWLSIDDFTISPSANNHNTAGIITRLRIYGEKTNSYIYNYSGGDPLPSNPNAHREELGIMAGTDIVAPNNNSSGVHYYGDNDSQHGGWIGFFTNGHSKLTINKQGRVGLGSRNLLRDYENYYKGRFNIIDPKNEPAIYIEGASSTEGDITWKDGEALQIGEWIADTQTTNANDNITGTFEEHMRITANGDVGIGTTNPKGTLDVSSTTGALIVPRMTTAQRDNLSAVNGAIIYNTTTNAFNFYENNNWVTK